MVKSRAPWSERRQIRTAAGRSIPRNGAVYRSSIKIEHFSQNKD